MDIFRALFFWFGHHKWVLPQLNKFRWPKAKALQIRFEHRTTYCSCRMVSRRICRTIIANAKEFPSFSAKKMVIVTGILAVQQAPLSISLSRFSCASNTNFLKFNFSHNVYLRLFRYNIGSVQHQMTLIENICDGECDIAMEIDVLARTNLDSNKSPPISSNGRKIIIFLHFWPSTNSSIALDYY